MKQIYAFENIEDYTKYQDITESFDKKLKEYQHILEKKYSLTKMPKAIVWTTEELATTILSTIPIPAYTNKDIIYMSPDLQSWRKLFIKQLDDKDLPPIQRFYENYSENHLMTILAHELTHHSDLFIDEFEDERGDSIWFEEGMCQYLPRKYLLNEKEFEEITSVEMELVEVFKDKYGARSLDEFGSSSYEGSLSSIMYDYWRSYLAVKYLVEVRANNDIDSIFDQYQNWNKEGRKIPLTEFFELN
ncbi:hypothetical protein [Bacillus sp. FJAT-22090]|uniref:hypothetical protein n=1 Tax=Bacillus sp. FJAT-22090 TaxID=1581038 RepID=UPI0011A087BD|nr:hypothetical protein [Bacillus sp. FJAT-22090]